LHVQTFPKRLLSGGPAMLKYLRIAVTAVSLTVCVLLVALWVRSYWICDVVYRMSPNVAT
jgi:hypothetical protein